MDRRAFLWMALAVLAQTGCVPRSRVGTDAFAAGEIHSDPGALPSAESTAQAKAIFKEFASNAWGADAMPAPDDGTRWMSDSAPRTEQVGTQPLSEGLTPAPSKTRAERSSNALPAVQARAGKSKNPKTNASGATEKAATGPVGPAAPLAHAGDIRRAANGIIMINPGEVIQFQAQGYCLDPDRPAPAAGEPMRFIPMAGLINFRLRRLFYKVLHKAGRQSAGYAADYQNVVWAVRTADARQNAWGDELGNAEKRLLDAAMPGGAALLQQVRRTATGRESGGRGLAPVISGVNFSADSQVHLRRLFNETPRGALPHSDAQFSMLSSGVAGRAENLGSLKVRWQIANSSDKVFAYDAAQWALESPRNVQREALPPPDQGTVLKV